MRSVLFLGWGFVKSLSILFVFASTTSLAANEEITIRNYAGSPVGNENWPAWRGWNTAGVAEGFPIPTQRLKKNGQVAGTWSTEVPGIGESSPVVWDGFVCLTFATDDSGVWSVHAACYSTKDGKVIWQKKLQTNSGLLHDMNSYASTTPATDGKLLFVTVGNVEANLYALDLPTGKTVWKQPLGNLEHRFGFSVSPIIYRNAVIQLAEGERRSFLAAYERTTGKQIWKVDRASTGSWGTPVVVALKDKEILVVPGGSPVVDRPGYIRAYDLKDGKELWKIEGTTPYVCASPVLGKRQLFCGSSRNDRSALFGINPEVDLSLEQRIAWSATKGFNGSYIPTGVYYRGVLYVVNDNISMLTAYDADGGVDGKNAGRVLYNRRLRGAFTASLLAGDGKIFAFSTEGEVYVFKPGDKYEEITSFRMPEGEGIWGTPAISRGRFYVRTDSRLWAIDGKAMPGDALAPPPPARVE